MRVVAYDPFVSVERFRELGVEVAETPDDVYAVADFLTAAPAADATRPAGSSAPRRSRGCVAASVSSTQRAGSSSTRPRSSTRCARAPSAGAALDVFSEEPYSGPLLEVDDVVVTPHLAASTEEAQDRAGVIVAEQVVAALEGGLVTNAVNIPSVGQEDLEVLGPSIPLAATLGRLAMELAEGRAARIAPRVPRRARGATTRDCSPSRR